MKTKAELLAEIEKLRKQIEDYCEEGSKYPKYMLSINNPKCEQYIVRFVSETSGEVVASTDNADIDIGYMFDGWVEHTDTECWKEVTNPHKLLDKDVVETWDDSHTHARAIRFYDAKHTKGQYVFSTAGERRGVTYDNIRKLMPWETPGWCEEARKTLEG